MPLYSDINANTPYLKPQVYDLNSVIQSIQTIIKTKKGEVLFLPEFGFEDSSYLFEQIDDTGALILFQDIINDITIWDSRVKLNMQKSNVVPDYDNNNYVANLFFTIQGFSGEFNITEKVGVL